MLLQPQEAQTEAVLLLLMVKTTLCTIVFNNVEIKVFPSHMFQNACIKRAVWIPPGFYTFVLRLHQYSYGLR